MGFGLGLGWHGLAWDGMGWNINQVEGKGMGLGWDIYQVKMEWKGWHHGLGMVGIGACGLVMRIIPVYA